MKRYHTLLLVAVWSCLTTYHCAVAQQIPQLSQYYWATAAYNPAIVGTADGINATIAIRNQWLGIAGLPLTQLAAVHTPVPLLRGGVGLVVANDMLGAQRQTSASLQYAFVLPLRKRAALSMGIQAGIVQGGLLGNRLISPDGIYTNGGIDHQDDLLPITYQGTWLPDVAAGVQYVSPSWQISIAARQILPTAAQWQLPNGQITTLHTQAHFLAQLSYQTSVGNNILLRPSLLLKTDLNSYQLDAAVLAHIGKQLRTSVSVRGYSPATLDAAIVSIGWQINPRLLLSQSYDISLSELRTVQSGTLETLLQYQLPNKWLNSKGKATYNPRFL